ncbi:ACR3 family arsenite efflux transporter [Candidatus Bathyarchaeota archaeon]|nr:ACR3 family arsenite efflux transporter [Candidatus Bathyarchaeota archaeon]
MEEPIETTVKANDESVDDDQPVEGKSHGLTRFEKYLYIWVGACMIAGIALSQAFPTLISVLDSWKVGDISVPIGICLFLMMYPAMLNVKGSELRKVGKNPKPILLTLISNWLVAPVVGALLSALFLHGNDQLVVAVILLSSSPCTAMVLVWGYLAGGNQEQNVINTSLNTITIMVGYAPLVSLLTGIQDIGIDWISLAVSVLVFIGIPLILGYISKRVLTSKKGEEWFNEVYKPVVGKIAIVALLTTLVVLFTLNGNLLIKHPDKLVLVSIPLLLGFFIVVGYNLIVTRLVGLKYRQAIITVIIGSSSHFEIAIATAITMFGVGSIAALGTTMGLFWEVPIMLGLVYMGKFLERRGFWQSDPSDERFKTRDTGDT